MNGFILGIFLFTVPGPVNSCRICHGGEGYEYSKSIHAQFFDCTECHGGNESILTKEAMNRRFNFKTLKNKKEGVLECARCHSDPKRMLPYRIFIDEFKVYLTSAHGEGLFKRNDEKSAGCADCHTAHSVKSTDDPFSSVYFLNVPQTCARCHSNEDYMRKYQIPTDQFEKYKKSTHGILRLEKKDMRAPGCAECHGVHGAVPPEVSRIHEVCGRCHLAQEEYFKKSPHSKNLNSTRGCEGCHGNHEVIKPTHNLFTEKEVGEGKGCIFCHGEDSPEYELAKNMRQIIERAEESVRGAKEWIERVRKKGFDVDEELVKLLETEGFIVESLVTLHSLNINEVRDFAQTAIFASEEIKSMAKEKLIEWRDRRVMFTFNIFIFTIISILLILKRRKLMKG